MMQLLAARESTWATESCKHTERAIKYRWFGRVFRGKEAFVMIKISDIDEAFMRRYRKLPVLARGLVIVISGLLLAAVVRALLLPVALGVALLREAI
jgi:hypothetical protein